MICHVEVDVLFYIKTICFYLFLGRNVYDTDLKYIVTHTFLEGVLFFIVVSVFVVSPIEVEFSVYVKSICVMLF